MTESALAPPLKQSVTITAMLVNLMSNDSELTFFFQLLQVAYIEHHQSPSHHHQAKRHPRHRLQHSHMT